MEAEPLTADEIAEIRDEFRDATSDPTILKCCSPDERAWYGYALKGLRLLATIAARDAEIERLRAHIAELNVALDEATGGAKK